MEPAASNHSIAVMAGGAPVLVLVIVVGDVLFLGPRGEVRAIENWMTAQQRYLTACARPSPRATRRNAPTCGSCRDARG